VLLAPLPELAPLARSFSIDVRLGTLCIEAALTSPRPGTGLTRDYLAS